MASSDFSLSVAALFVLSAFIAVLSVFSASIAALSVFAASVAALSVFLSSIISSFVFVILCVSFQALLALQLACNAIMGFFFSFYIYSIYFFSSVLFRFHNLSPFSLFIGIFSVNASSFIFVKVNHFICIIITCVFVNLFYMSLCVCMLYWGFSQIYAVWCLVQTIPTIHSPSTCGIMFLFLSVSS